MDVIPLLKIATEIKASDLHIIPDMTPLVRIDGDLKPVPEHEPIPAALTKELVYNIMTADQQLRYEEELVIDFSVSYPEIGNFRVSALHQRTGNAAVFRIIPETIPSFNALGLPTIFKALVNLSHGIILIAGPTGSGKSTTLASMIDFINTHHASHIITIEDPIEYIHNSKKGAMTQIQVGRDTTSFNSALRASLRQDPDIIQIGELRDLETIRLALTAAETGHLVLSTVHASSAPLTISRMVDVFPNQEQNRVRKMLAESLQAIVCQKLIKRVNGGRVGAYEILLGTAAIRHLIRQDMPSHIESTLQTSGDVGMCTMEQYITSLMRDKIISQATARAAIASRGDFEK